jgi:hypothetical protein
MRPSKSVFENKYLMKLVPMNPHPPVTNKFCIDPPQFHRFRVQRFRYFLKGWFQVSGVSKSEIEGFRI